MGSQLGRPCLNTFCRHINPSVGNLEQPNRPFKQHIEPTMSTFYQIQPCHQAHTCVRVIANWLQNHKNQIIAEAVRNNMTKVNGTFVCTVNPNTTEWIVELIGQKDSYQRAVLLTEIKANIKSFLGKVNITSIFVTNLLPQTRSPEPLVLPKAVRCQLTIHSNCMVANDNVG